MTPLEINAIWLNEKLFPRADAINIWMAHTSPADLNARDNRTFAAIELADVKKILDATEGMSFRTWCDEYIDISYDTARRLAKCGLAECGLPFEARERRRVVGIHLQTFRAQDAARQAKHREKILEDELRSAVAPAGADMLREAFLAVSAVDKLAFLLWATEEVGALIEFPGIDIE